MTAKEKQIFLNYLRNATNRDIQNLGISEEIAPLENSCIDGNLSYSIETLRLKNTLTISFVRTYWEEMEEGTDPYDYDEIIRGGYYLSDDEVLLQIEIPNIHTWTHFRLFKYLFEKLNAVIAL